MPTPSPILLKIPYENRDFERDPLTPEELKVKRGIDRAYRQWVLDNHTVGCKARTALLENVNAELRYGMCNCAELKGSRV